MDPESKPDHPLRKYRGHALVALIAAASTLLISLVSLGKVPLFARSGPKVAVHRVHLDAKRVFADVIFTAPVAAGKEGEILAHSPAEVSPPIRGVWRWQANNVLRFEPAGGFPMASEYKIILAVHKLLKEDEEWTGESTFAIRTDQFLVRRVTVSEEPVPSAPGRVVLRGEIQFNYAVRPDALAPLIRLEDGAAKSEVQLLTGWQHDVISFRTVEVQKQKDARTLALIIDGSLTPAESNVTLGTDYTQPIQLGSREHLAVRSIAAVPGEKDSAVRIELSSPVDAEVAAKYISVKPAVKYRISAEGGVLVLTGAFTPGAAYDVAVGNGLVAADSAVLRDDFVQAVQVRDLDPLLDFQSQGMFLSAGGYKSVAFQSINVARAKLTVDRVYRNNLFSYFQYYGPANGDGESYYGGYAVDQQFGDRIVEKELALDTRRNHRATTTLDLGKYVKAEEPGLYRVTVSREDEWRGVQRWILITDLGIVAKHAPDELTVWVSSFRDLSPGEGATVTLLTTQNQTVAKGQTDERGVWPAKELTRRLKGKKPYMLVVQRGDDFSFLLLDNTRVDTSSFDVGGDTISEGGYSAFVYGERDIYRPGEKVEGLAVVRDRRLGAPPAMPLVLRHKDPAGEERGSHRITPNAKGVAKIAVDLPAYTRTGHHLLEVWAGDEAIGSYRFQVEEFVPDRIKVEIKARPPAAAGRATEIAYSVESAYLFGPPAAGLHVESRVRLTPVTFTAKGYESFTFENGGRKFDPRELSAEQGTLDAQGKTELKVAIPGGLSVPSSLQATITARVREQGGRGVAALTRVPVHPYPYYVGLRQLGDRSPEPGQQVTFEYVAVGTAGAETAPGSLRADFYRDEWHTVLRRTSSGGYNYESTRDAIPLSVQTLPSGKKRGQFRFTPRQHGSYRVVVTDPATGASSELELYASGWGYSPWAMKNPGRLELALDKEEYAAGETATLQVKAPFPGRLMVTVERDRVFHTSFATLTSNSGKVTIPLAAELRPNAYVTATLVRAAKDLEPGEAGRAFGAIPVSVDRVSNRLSPAIKASQQMRSNRKLDLEVAAAPGAVVTIAAVDEGILQLVAQKVPDPFGYFYRKLALGVSTHDIYSLLLPEVRPNNRAVAGGGDGGEGLAQFVRTEGIRRSEPVAFWSGALEADANGKAKISFSVPEFQGALRVMAVVHDGDRFGSSETMVRVRDPITILPTYPRFLSLEEKVELPVTVRNGTAKDGLFDVSLSLAGEATPATQTQQVQLARDTEKTLYFPLTTASRAGEIRAQVSASGNAEKASSKEVIAVYPDLPPRTVEVTGNFPQPSATLAATGIEQFRAESVARELIVSPLPLVQFSGRLDYLLRYPYGCVEQTTSAAFPLIYFADIARDLDPVRFKKRDTAGYVREGIRRLGTMQLHHGGFAMWPHGGEAYPWGSVFATHFLVEARRAGHLVENHIHDRALDYVGQLAKARATYNQSELEQIAYALYVLARAGKADVGTMDFLRDRHLKDLSTESRALLGAAYAAIGNPRSLHQMIADIGKVDEVRRDTGGNLNSAMRDRALLLLAMLDAAPKDPRIPEIVQRLVRDANTTGYGWTTQESSFVLLALGQFFKQQKAKGPYSGTVHLDGKLVGAFDARTTRFAGLRGNGPIVVKMNDGYKEGAAYFAVRTRGIPADAAFKPSSAGVTVSRTYLTRDGKPITTVKQGDLLVVKVEARSLSGRVENVVIENLLPAGLEIENPRLSTTEALPWVGASTQPDSLDLRDDRVLFFLTLPETEGVTFYTLVRAVTPGTFRVPPVQIEAMYEPAIHATGERGTLEIRR
ncbi:MAG TPA: alpha-2-macroglobulin [Thermoanaerobaculia bacterium]|nr:alpha-2-macroglobulin [Thermoanaerobaculia bacterium]